MAYLHVQRPPGKKAQLSACWLKLGIAGSYRPALSDTWSQHDIGVVMRVKQNQNTFAG